MRATWEEIVRTAGGGQSGGGRRMEYCENCWEAIMGVTGE